MKPRAWALAFFAAVSVFQASRARAELLLVVEVSDTDADAASRLLELIDSPSQRVRMPEAEEPLAALDTARGLGADRAVILDGERHRVHVVRTRDGTVLTRVVVPTSSQSPAYLSAFVAVELLALSAQIEGPRLPEAARVDSVRGDPNRIRARAVQRLSGELIAAGAPFGGDAHPAFGAGVWLGRGERPRLFWLAELELGLLTSADVVSAPGRLTMERTDAGLRTGLAYAFGRVVAEGFGEGRASFTRAEYLGTGGTSARRFGLGVGLGAELDVMLARFCALFAVSRLDLATLRSAYRVQGKGVARDPARLLSFGLGLAFFQQFP